MDKLEVLGGNKLKGHVKISGSKNASLTILAASLLSQKKIYLIHNGEVMIKSKLGLILGTLVEGEMFGEVGPIIEAPRTVNAIAKTNCTLREIDNRNLQNKLNSADPVLTGIIRGLSLRIGDANALAEKYWQELSVYKSLEK